MNKVVITAAIAAFLGSVATGAAEAVAYTNDANGWLAKSAKQVSAVPRYFRTRKKLSKAKRARQAPKDFVGTDPYMINLFS